LEGLIKEEAPKPVLSSTGDTIEDPVLFALEKHLVDFLIANWSQLPLDKNYDVY